MISFPLTDADKLDRAQALAQICDAIDELEEERKEANAAFKQSLTALPREQRRLAKAIQTGNELRSTAEQLELPTEMPAASPQTAPPPTNDTTHSLPGFNNELSHPEPETAKKSKGAQK
jgi:hypothetical protein